MIGLPFAVRQAAVYENFQLFVPRDGALFLPLARSARTAGAPPAGLKRAISYPESNGGLEHLGKDIRERLAARRRGARHGTRALHGAAGSRGLVSPNLWLIFKQSRNFGLGER